MNKLYFTIAILGTIAISSCSDTKSYAELLNEENQCVNAFLAEHRVEDKIPADTVFEVGLTAPYYKLDEDGNVYMQVLDKGSDSRPEKGDKVYFRYMRYNLNYYDLSIEPDANTGTGNANNMNNDPVFFLFDDYYTAQSYQFGEGIQYPMKYLGYSCKVNLVIKSQAGPENDMARVTPYLFSISYNKPAL